MNKYQEALDGLKKTCKYDVKINGYSMCAIKNKESIECLQELIDKEEPKKPHLEGDGYADGELVYDTWVCPNCEKHYEVDYDKYDYCPNCGQHIDWSEDE